MRCSQTLPIPAAVIEGATDSVPLWTDPLAHCPLFAPLLSVQYCNVFPFLSRNVSVAVLEPPRRSSVPVVIDQLTLCEVTLLHDPLLQTWLGPQAG